MKYLVFSDLHGSKKGLDLLEEGIHAFKPDALICLGDTLHGAFDGDVTACSRFFTALEIPVIGVLGNCDWYYDETALGFRLPSERTLNFAGHRVLLRHTPFWASREAGDIVLYGHTHVKSLSKEGSAIDCNPGSIGKPRDGSYSYALLDETSIRLIDAETLVTIDAISL